MVDFDNEATVGTPAVDVERISILQRRYELLEAYEVYKKRKFAGSSSDLNIVKARLLTLFLELQATLYRQITEKDDYETLTRQCFKPTGEKDIIGAIYAINEILDKIHLTRVDTKKVYDSSDVETENKVKGYG